MAALEIYNLKGQLVKTLVKGITDAGRYSAIWNGTDNNGKICASGVYLYKLNTKNKTMVQKMLMLK
jgi:flagellar hook assembly protein FlgD